MTKISPSILSADFLNLGQELKKISQAQADMIHIDVMDGHFVPNLTMGPMIVKACKSATTLPLDVHLMINKPENLIDAFIEAGADYLTVHQENCNHLERVIKYIKSKSCKAGVAINPATNEQSLKYVIDQLDLVLIMSVNPGFGGQDFLPSVLPKIAAIKNMINSADNPGCLISVDGGINEQTSKLCTKAGADILVAGSFIFKQIDYKKAIKDLKL